MGTGGGGGCSLPGSKREMLKSAQIIGNTIDFSMANASGILVSPSLSVEFVCVRPRVCMCLHALMSLTTFV